MGITSSRSRYSQPWTRPLSIQTEPLCATVKENISKKQVSLRLYDLGSDWENRLNDWNVMEYRGKGQVYFRLEKFLSVGNIFNLHLFLLDREGRVVLWLEKIGKNSFNIYKGDKSPEMICQVDAPVPDWSKKQQSRVEFNDVLNGHRREIVFDGDWDKGEFNVYFRENCDRVWAIIARIWRAVDRKSCIGNKLERNYILRIAQGVDVALLVGICVAMDVGYGACLVEENRI